MIRLSKNVDSWKEYEKRDDIVRELKFASTSLKNIGVNNVLVRKAIEAFMTGFNELAYNIMYSNNKMGTREEDTLNKRFRNYDTNATGRLVLLRDK